VAELSPSGGERPDPSLATDATRSVASPVEAVKAESAELISRRDPAYPISILTTISYAVFAMPKERETIELQVVSSQAKIHGSFPNKGFRYTDVMFTQVNGKKIVYECVQRGHDCPLVGSGKTYTADRVGNVIYMAMSSPDGKQQISVKYKQLGSW